MTIHAIIVPEQRDLWSKTGWRGVERSKEQRLMARIRRGLDRKGSGLICDCLVLCNLINLPPSHAGKSVRFFDFCNGMDCA